MNNEIHQQFARLNETREVLDSIRQTLDTALDQIKTWQNSDANPSAEEWQQHRDSMVVAYARYRVLQDQYESLLRLNARLLQQHESAKQAFLAGWEARLPDLIAHLTEPEYTQLREALTRIDYDDHALPY